MQLDLAYSLSSVSAPASFIVQEGAGLYRTASDDEIVRAAQAVLARKVRGTCFFTSPGIVKDYLRIRVGGLDYEVFGAIFVDSQMRVIDCVELSRGTVASTSVHPREVVKAAIRLNASAVVLFHNHPSGLLEASTSDERLTRTLKETLSLIDVRVLDHFIVSEASTLSFAEQGLI